MCLGNLETCAQGVASDPEGNSGEGQGEDEAGHGSFRFDAVSLQGHGLVVLQQGAVCPLSHRGARHEQAHHVTTAAVMGAQRSAVPFHDGTTGEG